MSKLLCRLAGKGRAIRTRACCTWAMPAPLWQALLQALSAYQCFVRLRQCLGRLSIACHSKQPYVQAGWKMTRNQDLRVLHVGNASTFAAGLPTRIVTGDTLIFDFIYFLHPVSSLV